MGEVITFNTTNNTNGIVPVSLLGNNANQMDNANATTQYSWNITTLTFTTENAITVQYKAAGQASFQSATVKLGAANLQAVLTALNSLNLGSFFTTTSGGNTYINNYNENFVFGQLDIYDSLIPQLNYTFQTTPYGGGTNLIDVNAVNQVTQANPTNTSGSVVCANGDAIDFNGTTPSAGVSTLSVYDVTDSLYLINPQVIAPTTLFSLNFPVQSGKVYQISISTV